MAVPRLRAVGLSVTIDHVAVGAVPLRPDGAVGRGHHRRAVRDGEVDPGVHGHPVDAGLAVVGAEAVLLRPGGRTSGAVAPCGRPPPRASFFSATCWALRSIRSCVRLARSAKSSASAERLSSWVSSLLFAVDGLHGDTVRRGGRPSFCSLSPLSPLTEAAAMPATPITQADGTATVSRAERLAGVRRRDRPALRAAVRDAARPAPGRARPGRVSSWSSSSGSSAGSSSSAYEVRLVVGEGVLGRAPVRPPASVICSNSRGGLLVVRRAPARGRTRRTGRTCCPGRCPSSTAVASYTPVSKACVLHSHCWVWLAGRPDRPARAGARRRRPTGRWCHYREAASARGSRRAAGSRAPKWRCRTPRCRRRRGAGPRTGRSSGSGDCRWTTGSCRTNRWCPRPACCRRAGRFRNYRWWYPCPCPRQNRWRRWGRAW